MNQYSNELSLNHLSAPVSSFGHHVNCNPNSVKNIGIKISPIILNKTGQNSKDNDWVNGHNGLDLLSGSSSLLMDSPYGQGFQQKNMYAGYENNVAFGTGGVSSGLGKVSFSSFNQPANCFGAAASADEVARDAFSVRDPVKRMIPIKINLNQIKKRKLNDFKVVDDELVNYEYVNKMGNWIDDLRNESDAPDEEMEPSADLVLTLRDYQKQALAWMYKRETTSKSSEATGNKLPEHWEECATEDGKKYYFNKETHFTTWKFPYQDVIQHSSTKEIYAKGGILADDMGMGKSIEMLSLILTNRYSEKDANTRTQLRKVKTTLIVCPLSMLNQWKSELLAHSVEGSMSVYLFHGSNRNSNPEYLEKFDVVITTYSTLSSELPKDNGIINTIHWFRVILDEAHMIKDKKTRNAQAVYSLSSENRWAVTGTPIQNKLEDLFSLFKFIRVVPYSDEQWWKNGIQKPIQSNDQEGITRLKDTLRTVLLRRTKDQLIKDQPILPLPPRVSMIRKLSLSPQEQLFYDCIWNISRKEYDELKNEGKVGGKMAHILELLLRLRQSCNHPKLVIDSMLQKRCKLCKEEETKETTCLCNGLVHIAESADPRIRVSTSTKVNGLLYELYQIQEKDALGKSVVFSQWTSMLDIIGTTLTEAGIKWVRLDGKMSQQQRTEAITKFTDEMDIKVFLISMKAGGVGLNLTAASNVFLMDPWWNPATEEQAIDRVHRLGQKKPVSIYRFIISNSIEEKIQKLQESKRNIADKALSKGYDFSLKKKELELLFRS